MKELIYNYLESHFKLRLDSYIHYTLFDKSTQTNKGISDIIFEMRKVFLVDADVYIEVLEKWINTKVMELNLDITIIKDKLEEISGKPVDLNINDIDFLTKSNNAFLNYMKKSYAHTYPYDDFGMDVKEKVANVDMEGPCEPDELLVLEPLPVLEDIVFDIEKKSDKPISDDSKIIILIIGVVIMVWGLALIVIL